MRGGASSTHDSLVANSKIEQGLFREKMRITLISTIRHPYQICARPISFQMYNEDEKKGKSWRVKKLNKEAF